jgi:NADH-quinone oxidoreductase subunit L
MLIPVIVLAVPSLGLGFLGLWSGFADRLQPGASFHLTAESAVPIVWAVFGFLGTWWLWQRQAGDPARALGRLRPLFATGFYGDAIQNALIVRPVRELAQAVRRDDESLVDGAAVGTGRLSVGAGGLLAAAHRTGLPRAVVAVLGGAVLLVVAIAVIWP